MSEERVLYIGEKNLSSWSLRGWLALRHKQLPFTERSITLRDDGSRALRRRVSPTGKVPVLHDRGLVIPDSLAIIEYLEETYPAPQHPQLWPRDPAARAHARWLSAAMHSGFMALRAGMSFNLCFLKEDLRTNEAAIADAREMMSLWEPALAQHAGTGPYLFGTWSACDVMFAPAVVRLTAFRVPTDGFAHAARYMNAVLEQPDLAEWMKAARQLTPVATY